MIEDAVGEAVLYSAPVMQDGGPSLTPMFRQYQALKKQHPDSILLFRMGDFYEMFHQDAKEASSLLDIALTARGKGTAHVAPMCGFPHHQLEAYTAKLVRAGRRVAICEQVEDPKSAKGLVRREIIRIVTPGTVTDPAQLDAKVNAWIAGVATAQGRAGAAFLDASTGEFLAWQSPDDADAWETLADRLAAFSPREIVHAEDFPWPEAFRTERTAGAVLSRGDPFAFAPDGARELLLRHLGVASLDGFGLKDRPAAVAAAGGLLVYLQETQKSGLEHIDGLVLHEPSHHLRIDPSSRRNLEIERSLREGDRQGSLLAAVDNTVTPAGARLLRQWLLFPLIDPGPIGKRHEAVADFLARPGLRGKVRDALRRLHDVERLVGRTVGGTANARDLLALRNSLQALPPLAEALAGSSSPLITTIAARIDPSEDLASRLAAAVEEPPPPGLKDGGLIRAGFDPELDELRAIRRDGRSYIAALEAREREATGISSLKVRFNRVFGYSIEVSKSNLHLVPDSYVRKQTLANGERYITPELKEHESKVLHAQERIIALEHELFTALRSEIAGHAARLKTSARAAAEIDVLAGLAETAFRRSYCRPRVIEAPGLMIRAGRHAVVEQALPASGFIPNDTDLTVERSPVVILTGPNMGGKSTYLRQVALIVLLAQAGSYVPAEEAEVGVVDRIFCRVGGLDNLAEGQSTFMVEMTETANILHHATSKSLVLLDEIGRGTSTFDGLAIAWAVVESLAERSGGPPRTLFATHYHELTELAVALRGVTNCRMAVREWGDRVVFLHRVESGAADRSYGIHVARLAGIPSGVVGRAGEILRNLEQEEYGTDGLPRRARRDNSSAASLRGQPSLFGPAPTALPADPAAAEVLAEIRGIEAEQTTPLEALNLLHGWVRRLRRNSS